ncbi:MAG: tRNA (adenosine(37)-N6)-threonylcarbamoyltransferase complex dimerization subunit type 1 TsaB [Nitrospina sp.]|jgi:tRNA threonylcarbamoyladenosine biosynthesis protein TsaB|nr:tRNA (adenosine(37)-N6)-threonylcarbamoyltransferase complex dimerization subunit type 1 TsaB [Nitrospina sp.]MBT6601268.1 tRNA (adenosine(37)-N6)-threonylcarbamoyltransferase complex dimerization subunit type 1 TsaB [Nitrospina sp.]
MGIDSSTPQASVAILKNGQILSQADVDATSTVSSQILFLIDKVLKSTDLDLMRLDGFCLTTGPGSFTGLRVGASILKGLLLATSKPYVKIDTLEAIALQATPTSNKICAILDARKKEIYSAYFFENDGVLERLTPDRALSPSQLCQEITGPTVFIGNGLSLYGPLLTSELGRKLILTQNKITDTVAACAARLAESRFTTTKTKKLSNLTIKYVRKSEAELKFK